MKFQRHVFTLFELLISIGLLVILSVALLRVFVLTGDFWSAGDEQARLYADAKTALSMISEDLENIVYQNTNSDGGTTPVTAPIWLEAWPISTSTKICSYTSYATVDGTPGAYTAALHMITRTTMRLTSNANSDICEVDYYFMPPTSDGTDWSTLFSRSGTLVRCCVDDNDSNEYNFLDRTSPTAMTMPQVFHQASDPDEVQGTLQKLITGVLDFRIYAWQKHTGDTAWNSANIPADLVTSDATPKQVVLAEINHSGDGQTGLNGAVDIVTIQILLTVMPPKRIDELRHITDSEEQKAYIHKYARTFRKTIGIKEVKP